MHSEGNLQSTYYIGSSINVWLGEKVFASTSNKANINPWSGDDGQFHEIIVVCTAMVIAYLVATRTFYNTLARMGRPQSISEQTADVVYFFFLLFDTVISSIGIEYISFMFEPQCMVWSNVFLRMWSIPQQCHCHLLDRLPSEPLCMSSTCVCV